MIRVAAESPADAAAWDHAAAHHPGATWFHQRAWAEAWCAHFGGTNRAEAWTLRFTDSRAAVVAFTSYQPAGLPHRRLFLNPGGTYGGPLSAQPLHAEHHHACEHWLAQRGEVVWRRPPAAETGAPSDAEPTHVFDLSRGAAHWEKVWRRNGLLRKARRSESAGVQIIDDAGPAARAQYHRLVTASAARWHPGTPHPYDAAFFDRLATLPGVRLLRAVQNGHALAGAWLLGHRGHTVYWHGAADADAFALRPVNLLMLAIARTCLAHGDRWFDLNPSGGHAGAEAFKRSLGAEPWASPLTRTPARATEPRRAG